MMKYILIFIAAIAIIISVMVIKVRASHAENIDIPINLEVSSEAFENDGIIPQRYTGKGEDLSPPLKLGEVNQEGKTIAIIMDDLDHPLGIYNHWVIWNIPSEFKSIPEGIEREEIVASLGSAVQGKSDYGRKISKINRRWAFE